MPMRLTTRRITVSISWAHCAKRTVEWQQSAFLEKKTHNYAHAGAMEKSGNGSASHHATISEEAIIYCQRCWLFGDPSTMQKEWANDVSGNPKNFGVRSSLTRKPKRTLMLESRIREASFFFGVRIMLGMTFNYLILWVRVKGQG